MTIYLSLAYFNPYYENNFLEFFVTFLHRLGQFIKGNLPIHELASDEIQMLVLSGVAASSALVGTFLILRKMTMVANSLSHTILLGILAAFFLTKGSFSGHFEGQFNIPSMLLASLFVGLITTFLSEFLTKGARLQEDASTGIVFTALFALGIVLVTLLTRDTHIGAEIVMGNVDALHFNDCKLVYTILGINLLVFALFYKQFLATTFDPAYANALGITASTYNYALMALVSATVVGAFRAIGVLMVLAFITGPPLTARMMTSSLKTMLSLAALIGIGASVIGVALSRHLLTVYGLALSTAGVVVLVAVCIYLATLLLCLARKRSMLSA